MKESLIAEHEKSFESTLTDSSGKKFTISGTTDLGDGIHIKKLKSPTPTGFYYQEKTPKNMIVIHSTIGVIKGDVATLSNSTNPVSVSYLISRAGIIYEMFDPNYWSYHLGKGTIGGNKVNSARSIGIELSNLGPLTLVNGALETVYSRKSVVVNGISKTTAPDVYCAITDTTKYTKLDTAYRGYQYFAAYTPAQYLALNKLTTKLCSDFSIPNVFVDEAKRFAPFTESEATSFHGICSHVNYRTSGKWDVGPDFNWGRVINPSMSMDTKPTIAEPAPIKPIESVPVHQLSPSTGLPPFLPPSTVNDLTKKTTTSLFSGFVKRLIG